MSWIDSIPPTDVFFDAGPGKLNSEAWLVKKKWPKVSVIGVEPDVKRFEHLKPKFPGKLLRCAISDKDGTISMQRIDGMSINFPRANQINPKSRFESKCRSFDSLAAELFPKGSVFVWADIEGAELLLLKGAEKTISEGRITGFYLEVWRERQCDGWATREEVTSFLTSRGYYEHQVVVMGKHHGDVVFLRRPK